MGFTFDDWTFDPQDPRLPSAATWARMSESVQRRVADLLPPDPEPLRVSPEGDPHYEAVLSLRETLRHWFQQRQLGHYVGVDKAVYYHDEPVFSPDIFVVLNVDTRPRHSWQVASEGRGPDVVFEIVDRGSRTKDLKRNVERFARFGIGEYFVFDLTHGRLYGFRLPPGGSSYERLVPQQGTFHSETLSLDVGLDEGQLRLRFAGADLPDHVELAARLQASVHDAVLRAEAEAHRADAEASRAAVAAEQAAVASERADAESERADAESERADVEARRADEAAERVRAEADRAAALAARVAALEARLAELESQT